MPVKIKRNEYAIYLRFSDSPIADSEMFADDFVVDYGAGDHVVGLEIITSESRRAGTESALLAFGLAGTAIAGLSWRYNEVVNERSLISALHQKLEWLIEQAELDLKVLVETPVTSYGRVFHLDLVVFDAVGNPLLCVEVKYGGSNPEAVKQQSDSQVKSYLATQPNAVGIVVIIDETGSGYPDGLAEPERWIDWPNATGSSALNRVWAHISIIPPADHTYPWLPEGFLPTRGVAPV